jgi:ADP-ribose pyrophosphatase YjhB (NUDIX family)
MARPRVAAGLLIRDDTGRVLLVKPTYKDGWDIPGGYVEPGETPTEACARELMEELSLQLQIGPPLVFDWAAHPAEGDKLLIVFDGGVPPASDVAARSLDHVEVEASQFWDVADLHRVVPDRLARRLRLAVEATEAKSTVYAENGVRVACK